MTFSTSGNRRHGHAVGAASVAVIVLMMVLLGAARTARADDAATAEAEFREGRRLVKEGRFAEACPHLETSVRLKPELGSLLNLAICQEATGRTASAFDAFLAAAELARQKVDGDRESLARGRAEALRPRLAYLRIDVGVAPAAGLVIRRGPTDVSSQLGVPTAVDPGEHELEASAPGHRSWSATITAVAGELVAVEVPALVPVERPRVEHPVVERREVAPIAATASPRLRLGSRQFAAVATGSTALLAVAVALTVELEGRAALRASRREQDDVRKAQLLDYANLTHYGAQAFAVAGAGLAVTSVYLWLTARDPGEGTPRLQLSPGSSVSSPSVSVKGTF